MREHDSRIVTSRARRNSRIAAREIRESETSARLLNCLGDACRALNDNARAAKFFQHALAASEPDSSDRLEAYYGLVSTAEGKLDAQLAHCAKAINDFPIDITLLYALGGFMLAKGQPKMVLRAYQAAYRHGTLNSSLWHLAELRDIVAICYSRALQIEHRDAEARAVLEQAVEMKPDSLRLRRQMIDFYVKRGSQDAALHQVDQMSENGLDCDSLRTAVRGALLAAQRNWQAAHEKLTQARAAGCRDPLCLRWLTMTQLALSEFDGARRTLGDWLTLDPSNPDALRCKTKLDSKKSSIGRDGRLLRIDTGDQPVSARVKLLGRTSVFDGA